jgi:hypothetical protein
MNLIYLGAMPLIPIYSMLRFEGELRKLQNEEPIHMSLV